MHQLECPHHLSPERVTEEIVGIGSPEANVPEKIVLSSTTKTREAETKDRQKAVVKIVPRAGMPNQLMALLSLLLDTPRVLPVLVEALLMGAKAG